MRLEARRRYFKAEGRSNRIEYTSDKVKDVDDADDCVASQLAFLGPNIWERMLPSSLVDLNIEGFGDLETNVDFSTFLDADLPNCPQVDIEAMLAGVELPAALPPEQRAVIDSALLQGTIPCVKQNVPVTSVGPRKRNSSKSCNPVPKVSAPEIFPNSVNTPSTGSFTSSTGSFSPPHDELSQTSQMSQFSGSGDETFDPSKRAFSDEELRLLPVLKKSRKIFVPDDLKDDKYWARRIKNNTAAKRSREARRLKENQITMRTSFLEKENAFLKSELQRVLVENESLKSRVEKYEAVCQKMC